MKSFIKVNIFKSKSSGGLFGRDLRKIDPKFLKLGIPFFMWEIGQCVLLTPKEGVFRVTGDVSVVSKMKKEIVKHNDVTFKTKYKKDIHSMVAVISTFLRELPTPILSNSNRTMFSSIITRFHCVSDLPKTVVALTLALSTLDKTNRKYLLFLLNMYYTLCANDTSGTVNFFNTATCVAPSFFSQRYSTMSAMSYTIESQVLIISTLISMYPLLSFQFEESHEVLCTKYNISQEQYETFLAYPESYNLGNIHFS
ncbi:hypothetical protein EIN_080420 [Entamoeba invadens IP1]|uniref:hypothetical protein n=1 Tax=Entamoeba invadens IP1 TaxID=370355 RepID=UPI0002C3E3D0|nr:hypothetical protein EIN_080420 [Entamoeba invadens IP1]ELP85080.1 hypothetical protein EIN_080420 [Entamoeba invadens IP1]|eukprot:XP_004184426.1 hypothetical protein EIN_080420 [Entamoeba invadens IP1]